MCVVVAKNLYRKNSVVVLIPIFAGLSALGAFTFGGVANANVHKIIKPCSCRRAPERKRSSDRPPTANSDRGLSVNVRANNENANSIVVVARFR